MKDIITNNLLKSFFRFFIWTITLSCLTNFSIFSQQVSSSAIPSNSNPNSGETITVDIEIDMTSMSPPNNLLGSFTGTLDYNENVLDYTGDTGIIIPGFAGNVVVNESIGLITFNGANASGTGGTFDVVQITFDVIGAAGTSSPLDLEYSAMAAALTFTNLLTFLTINDGNVTVGGGGGEGEVISSAIPSNSNPNSGETITVDIEIDMTSMSPPNNLLGSFTGTLDYNENVLDYTGDTGVIIPGFAGNVVVNESIGLITFNGANASGTGGTFDVVQITFDVIGAAGTSSLLDLEYSAMAAALTFTNLLPFLTINDGNVTVGGGGGEGEVISSAIPSNSNPNSGETITVDIEIDMTSMSPPNNLLGSFTGTLDYNENVLDYTGDTGIIIPGFAGNVVVNESIGLITFNGANASGTGGTFDVVQITFDVIGAAGTSSLLDLEYSAMAAALTFTNLLTFLTINDGNVTVGGGGGEGEVISSAIPSNSNPNSGETITVDIEIDMTSMSPPNNLLGSFTGTLDYNENVLDYTGDTGIIIPGFAGNVVVNESIGLITFNGANASGTGGTFDVVQITFDVIGAAGTSSLLDLEYSAMASALTFTNLLPFLTINDGNVTVGGGGGEGEVISSVIPSNSNPNSGETITVDMEIDMTSMSPPNNLLGSFTGTLDYNENVLDYTGDTGIIIPGFAGNVVVNESIGLITFNGANASGTGGTFDVVQITFDVIGAAGTSSPLDLEYSAMAAALTFTNLLPFLTINDGNVVVSDAGGIPVSINPDNDLGGCDEDIKIPVVVGDLTNQGIFSFEFTVTFDPTALLSADGIDIVGDIDFTGWSVLHNAATPGEISVAGFGAAPLSGSGVLLYLLFHTADIDGATSPLNFTNFLFNAGTPAAATTNGSVTLKCCVCGDADGNDLVQAFDASLTLQHVLGLITLENPECVDVDENGLVQAFDASLILHCVLGLTPPVPTCCSDLSINDNGNYIGKINLNIVLEEIQHQTDEIVAVLNLTGFNNTEQVSALQFDLELPSDETQLEIFELPGEYISQIHKVSNNIYKVGIVNPYGLDASEIKLALGSKNDFSGMLVKFSNIFINSQEQGDINTLLSGAIIPQEYSIRAYPNPFNPRTIITYALPVKANVEIKVFDLLGREVISLVAQEIEAGTREIEWDATNYFGTPVSSGTYIIAIKTENFFRAIKINHLK